MKTQLLLLLLGANQLLTAQIRFTEVTTPWNFTGSYYGSVAFADIDNDGDQDLLITGFDGSIQPMTKLYTNDQGEFSEVSDTPFEGVAYSSVAFADVDDDGDQDLLITGENSASQRIAKLYTNEAGVFPELSDTPFEGVAHGSVAFADVDDDGDQDLLITGENSASQRIAKLYNNEAGAFSEVNDTPFEGVAHGSVAFA
ncbi:MAG: VCBS repeat-containing protein, partial [Bacteroidetes bacterium]